MKPAQHLIDEFFRHEGKAHAYIIGKACVKRRRERKLAPDADRACRQSHRAFCGDVDGVGRVVVDELFETFAWQNRKADFAIGRQRDAEAALRACITDLMAQSFEVSAQYFQRAHHTVDLRRPGVGDNEDFQRLGLARKARARRWELPSSPPSRACGLRLSIS